MTDRVMNFWSCYKCNNVNRGTDNNCIKCGCSIYRIGHTEAQAYTFPAPRVKPTIHNPKLFSMKVKNEFQCQKCGLDAGVVEVHGHTQCANCGHIIQDCCGD